MTIMVGAKVETGLSGRIRWHTYSRLILAPAQQLLVSKQDKRLARSVLVRRYGKDGRPTPGRTSGGARGRG
jgi:hypothetical protein